MKEIKLVPDGIALVDDDDFESLNQWTWYRVNIKPSCTYAMRHGINDMGKRTSILMHREIMGNPIGLFVDHKNGNGLDNQKFNLRECTHDLNNKNRGANTERKYVGVGYGTWGHKHYRARIRINGINILIGYFYTEEEAARAYDKIAIEQKGEYTRLNFPFG